MLRINTSAAPLVWHTVQINQDGESTAVKVRYRILTKDAVDARSADRLALARTVRGGDEGKALDAIIERLTPDQRESMRIDLRRAVAEWDIADQDGAPLAVTPETLDAVLAYGIYLLPLYDGLIEASNGAAAKNS